MRKLAREAGLSVTTLYNLVGSRDEILQALIDSSAKHMVPQGGAVAGAEGDPLSRTARDVEDLVSYVVLNESIMRPHIAAEFARGYYSGLVDKDGRAQRFLGLKRSLHVHLEQAKAQGQVRRGSLNPGFVESQIYVGFELALIKWAFGFLDGDEFLLWSLSGTYVALLAIATPANQPGLEKALRKVERRLRKKGGAFLLPPSGFDR
jgi:AcrR family transcriptional regulator